MSRGMRAMGDRWFDPRRFRFDYLCIFSNIDRIYVLSHSDILPAKLFNDDLLTTHLPAHDERMGV